MPRTIPTHEQPAMTERARRAVFRWYDGGTVEPATIAERLRNAKYGKYSADQVAQVIAHRHQPQPLSPAQQTAQPQGGIHPIQIAQDALTRARLLRDMVHSQVLSGAGKAALADQAIKLDQHVAQLELDLQGGQQQTNAILQAAFEECWYVLQLDRRTIPIKCPDCQRTIQAQVLLDQHKIVNERMIQRHGKDWDATLDVPNRPADHPYSLQRPEVRIDDSSPKNETVPELQQPSELQRDRMPELPQGDQPVPDSERTTPDRAAGRDHDEPNEVIPGLRPDELHDHEEGERQQPGGTGKSQ